MTSSPPSTSSDASLRPAVRFAQAPREICGSSHRRRHAPRHQGAQVTVLRLTHALMLRSARHLSRVAELLTVGYAAVVRSMADERHHHALRLAETLGHHPGHALGPRRADNPRTPDRWRRIYVAAVERDEPSILELVCDIELELLAELRVLSSTMGLPRDTVAALAPLVETLATDCYLLDHLALTARRT